MITGLEAGTYVVEEINAPHGYVMDTAPQTAYISGNEQDCITLTFTNSKYGALLIKKVDSVTGEPLSDVQFFVTDSGGSVVGTGNGYFTTDSAGTILIPDIMPGTTLVVKETRTRPGYILDDAPQTIKVQSNATMTVEFRNQPTSSLLIRKVCSVDPSVTLQDAEFKVTYADGSVVGDSNGVYRTDENGEIRIDGLTPGKSVVVTETRAPAGFLIDTQSQTAEIQAGKTVSLTFKNQPKGELIVQKRDSDTNQPLAGAQFRVTTAAGCEVGLDGVIGSSTLTQNGIFTTDSNGEIRISNLAPGAYVLTEIKAPDGYVMDSPSTNVVIGTNGDTQTVVITNTRKGGLIVEKYDSVTRQPLAGAQFKIMNANGELTPDNEGLTSSNGLYTTDVNGQIVLSKLLPGTYVVTEVNAPDHYRADPTPQTVVVNAGDTQTLRFYDDPLCTLTILKRDAVTKKPLAGGEFWVRDSEGRAVGPNNGVYVTGSDGTAIVTGLQPDATIVVSEVKAPTGYILDETPKHIVVRSGEANTLIFDDEPGTTLIIHKYIEGTENEPLSGVAFKVVDGPGAAIGPDDGVYYTDKAGEIVLEGIEPGTTVIAREIKTVEGYVLDGTPQDIKIEGGRVQQLTFWNKKAGELVIQKKDAVSGAFIAGAEFQLTYAAGGYVDNDNGHLSSNGLYTTNDKGEIRVYGITGTVVVKETKAAPGYVIDQSTQIQTVTVNPEDTQTLTFLNQPLCSLTLTKLDSVTGKPVPGTEFTVTDGDGRVLGRYTTGKDGTVTVTGLVPGSTVVVRESKVPSGYVLDTTPKTIIVKNGSNSYTTGVTAGAGTGMGTGTGGAVDSSSGGGNDLTFENDPLTKLVIEKYVAGTTTPLKGVTFLVTDSAGTVIGGSNGEYITDENGRIVIEGLEPGTTVVAKELRTVEGYVLDTTPKSIKIKVGDAQVLRFYNEKQGTLVVRKLDRLTNAALAGAEFQITYADGRYLDADYGHVSGKGLYKTDASGEIRIPGVVGTVIVRELKAAPGYVIDAATQEQTITVNTADAQTLTFYNEPLCSLTLTKLDSVTGKPVPGTEFTVKDGNGNVLGRYVTGEDGTVTVTGLIPGSTVVVSESRVPNGYVLDPTPKTIVVRNGANSVTSGSTGTGTATGGNTGTGSVTGSTAGTGTGSGGNNLTFENDPTTTLVIEKYAAGTSTPLKGVTFLVTNSRGEFIGSNNGEFTTDENGRIQIKGLEPGVTITAKEIRTLEGYILDTVPKSIEIKAGDVQTLTFYNEKAGELVIRKLDSKTKEPLPGVEFELSYAGGGFVDDANGHISSNGLYTTDSHGEIHLSGITGTIIVKETKTIPGYTIDESTRTQTVTVNPRDTQTLTFYNDPKQALTIQKFVDGTTDPIQGATFLITDSSGQALGNSTGEFTTDRNGRIVLTDLVPGTTITARETRAADGYVLDTTPQSILIKQGEAQVLTFYNKSEGGLELIKVSAADKSQRITGVTFEIRRMDGGLVDTITTGDNGRVFLPMDAGDYYAVEIEAAKGFKVDSTPHYFTIQDGETTTLTVTNQPFSGILIHKIDSITEEGIYDVKFLLYDENKWPIGEYTTDNEGYIYIDDDIALGESTRFYIRELEAAEGYTLDKEYKTVYLQPGKVTEIEWKNTPVTGQIQIYKFAAEANPVTGTAAGTPLKGAVYEIVRERSGKVVDYITTDARGVAASKPLPLGRYKIVEVTAPAYWQVDPTAFDVTLEYSGQIIKLSAYDKPSNLGVTITKRGNAEVLTGDQMWYTFTVANTSNVDLENFYWHDRIPTDATRAATLVTGKYSFRLSYRILYKTNFMADYQVLASNLVTTNSYSFNLNAIPKQSGEMVTDIYFDFGKVPMGFQSTSDPQLAVVVSGTVANGYQIVNRADVGGKYQGAWENATANWVTIVRKLTSNPTLPKTGY